MVEVMHGDGRMTVQEGGDAGFEEVKKESAVERKEKSLKDDLERLTSLQCKAAATRETQKLRRLGAVPRFRPRADSGWRVV